jgi:hypothetical protein
MAITINFAGSVRDSEAETPKFEDSRVVLRRTLRDFGQ